VNWGRRITERAHAAEVHFDSFRFGLLHPFEILPYGGHGTSRELFLTGRVLEVTGITRSSQSDTAWNNLRNMARRFASDEVAGARVRASFRGIQVEVVADEEGFFEVRFELPESLAGPTKWHPVGLELTDPTSPGGEAVCSTGQVLVPSEARVGIISDIDDTVVRSSATNMLKMAWIVFLNNAHTRLPLEGGDRLLRGLAARRGRPGPQPYLLCLEQPVEHLRRARGLPERARRPCGTAVPQRLEPNDPGEAQGTQTRGHPHAAAHLPELPFVLIGDSGEEDPEIYCQAVREHPGRILAIYIRVVTTGQRDAEVRAVAKEVRGLGVEMTFAPDTAVAAEHAAARGLIAPDAVPGIRARSSATA
jgi:phosphatidate phosphatase APP1